MSMCNVKFIRHFPADSIFLMKMHTQTHTHAHTHTHTERHKKDEISELRRHLNIITQSVPKRTVARTWLVPSACHTHTHTHRHTDTHTHTQTHTQTHTLLTALRLMSCFYGPTTGHA